MIDETIMRELIAWWRGVAKDEREGATRWRRSCYAMRANEAEARAAAWDRCADQLELALAGKPFHPDV